MTHILEIFSYRHFIVLSSTVITFLISYRMFPVIIHICHKKKLMQTPGERNSHIQETPSLGGIGLFVAFSLSLTLFGMISGLSPAELVKLLSVLAATTILLFLGIKDDLIVLAPKQKFIGQMVSSCIVIFMTDMRIESFNGLLGIYEVPYMVSVIFSLFVFILVINAYNLIDGIDGLAGFLGIIASTSFGIYFFLNDHMLFMLVSSIITGSIIGFLRYNLSESHKLFMGDSGSLFVGYLLAYQGICLLDINTSSTISFHISNAPVLLLAILSFPLLDTLRVFAIRIKAKRSPFTADRNHIHHRLLDIGCTHKQATLVISVSNVFVITVAILLSNININFHLVLVVITGVIVYLSPFMVPLKDNAKLEPDTSRVLKINTDHEELNEQLKLRNRLLVRKRSYGSGYSSQEDKLIVLDNAGADPKSSNHFGNRNFAIKRSKYLRKFKSDKQKLIEDN